MPITINNVTANNQITIINDSDVNESDVNNGPAKFSGNTEADVIIDRVAHKNLTAHDVIPSNIHALQFNPNTNTGEIEYTDSTSNLQLASADDIPSWANTMITRWKTEEDIQNPPAE